MSSSPIVLILGAGANIGQGVARAFASKGYKIALVSRNPKDFQSAAQEQVHIGGDLSDPSSIPGIFTKVKSALGIPSVVVYNAGAAHRGDPQNPLSPSLSEFTTDLAINTTSVYAAAQEAVAGFEQLPDTTSRTFIYTGNCTNVKVLPIVLTLGVGKAATANLIHAASEVFKEKGYKFYYADERKADGAPAMGGIDGEAHGKLYVELAEGKSQGPWQQTFVKGVGYKAFS